MVKIERIREVFSGPPEVEYLRRKTEEGWRLAAVEWTREVKGGEAGAAEPFDDVPFGLRIASDCTHLEEEPTEKEALVVMMELIVEDYPLGRVASELNRKGYRTRQGTKWTPGAVFDLIPRLVEVGPRIFTSKDWIARKERAS